MSTTIKAPSKQEPGDYVPWRICFDGHLLPETLALLTFVRCLPAGWEIRQSFFSIVWGWKKHKLQKVFSNAVETGYLRLVKGGVDGGSFYRVDEAFSVLAIDKEDDYAHAMKAFDRMYREVKAKHDGARAGKSTSRSKAPDSGGESRKNRQSEKPTVGKSTPLNNKEPIKQERSIIPPPLLKETLHTGRHNGGGSVIMSNINLSFMTVGDMGLYRSTIEALLTQYPDESVKLDLWTALFGDMAEIEHDTVRSMWGQHGHVRCVAAAVIVKEKGRTGSRLNFFYTILTNFGETRNEKSAPSIPAWADIVRLGCVTRTGRDYLIEKGIYEEDQLEHSHFDKLQNEDYFKLRSAPVNGHIAGTDSATGGSATGGIDHADTEVPPSGGQARNHPRVRAGLHGV